MGRVGFSSLCCLKECTVLVALQRLRAAAQNFADVLMNSGDLYRSFGGYPGSDHGMPTCCDAMEAEIMPGDIILIEKNKGAGMTVR